MTNYQFLTPNFSCKGVPKVGSMNTYLAVKPHESAVIMQGVADMTNNWAKTFFKGLLYSPQYL